MELKMVEPEELQDRLSLLVAALVEAMPHSARQNQR